MRFMSRGVLNTAHFYHVCMCIVSIGVVVGQVDRLSSLLWGNARSNVKGELRQVLDPKYDDQRAPITPEGLKRRWRLVINLA